MIDPVLDFDPCRVIKRKKYITPNEVIAMLYEKSEDKYVIIIFKDGEIVNEIDATNAWLSSKSVTEIDTIMDNTVAKMSKKNPW